MKVPRAKKKIIIIIIILIIVKQIMRISSLQQRQKVGILKLRTS